MGTQAIKALLGKNTNNNGFDSSQVAANADGSALERLEFIQAALEGSAGIASFPAAAAPANGVSMAEVARDTWDALRNGTGGSEPGTNKSLIDALGCDGSAALTSAAGQLRTAQGTPFVVQIGVTSSSIPNNTQTAGSIALATGAIVIEDILLETDGTGLAGPTNLNLTVDNAKGLTGASNPLTKTAISGLGANKTISMKSEASVLKTHFPFTLETGKKLYVSGDDAGGSGAGTVRITLLCKRASDGATIAATGIGS